MRLAALRCRSSLIMSSTLRLPSLRFVKSATARASKRLRLILSTFGRAYSRWPRWARLTAVLLATVLGSLISCNGVLNLGMSRPYLARIISVNPQSLGVDYRRAWSFWPTLVYVRNLEVRGSDANVQWQLDVDEARASIDLTALLKREVHVTKVRAQGIGFRLRQKIDPPAATDDRLAPLPPIPGIEGPPVRESGPPPPDIPDEKYDLWSVRIENVDGRARQLWVNEFHFEGDVHVKGAFFLRPKRWLWVGPAKATIFSGSVVLGDEKLFDHAAGSVDCTVPPFDPRPPTGMEFFRFISGAVRLDANISSARAFDYYTRIRGSSAVFDGGMGVFHLEGSMRSGVVRPLNVSVDMSKITAAKSAWLALGSLQVSAKTDTEGPTEWLARIAPFELRQAGATSAAIHGTELRIKSVTDAIDVSRPAPDFQVHGDLPSAQVPDLRIINTFTSSTSQLHVDGGNASIAANFDANSGTNRAKGDLAVGADAISAHDGGIHFVGR